MLKILIVSLLFAPLSVFAHGDGLSLEFVKEGYLADVGYNSEFVEGDTVRFDLELYKDATKDPVPFSKAWVRITKDEKVLFAGSLANPTFGKPGLSLALSEGGGHNLFVRFERGDESIVEVDLPFIVALAEEDKKPISGLMVSFVIGALVGGAAGLALRKNKR